MRFQTIVAPTITELFERQIQGMILSGADDEHGVLRLLSVDDPDALPDGAIVG